MAIRDDLVRVLRSSTTQGISFTISGATIGGVAYTRVANDVAGTMTPAGRLYARQVIVVPGLSSHTAQRDGLTGRILQRGFDAEYRSRENVFVFSAAAISGVHAEALAVHEATHAAFDAMQVSLWAIDDEAAAYVAQAVYLTRSGVTAGAASSPTFTAAFAAAASIVAGNGLTAPLLQQIRMALQANPNYRAVSAATSRYLRDG